MPGVGAMTLDVFLLDDHDIVRRGLRDLLAPAHDLRVVGESHSAAEGIDMILELKPDVILLDVQLQDGTSIEVCRRARAADPGIRGLLLTSAGDDEALVAAVLAGAHGYLVKLANSVDVLGAVRRVGAGRSLIDRELRQRVVDRLRTDLIDGPEASMAEPERTLLSHLLDGATDTEIAERIGEARDVVAGRVAALIEELTQPGAPPTQGKHRRSAD